jgi:hypothetical protein
MRSPSKPRSSRIRGSAMITSPMNAADKPKAFAPSHMFSTAAPTPITGQSGWGGLRQHSPTTRERAEVLHPDGGAGRPQRGGRIQYRGRVLRVGLTSPRIAGDVGLDPVGRDDRISTTADQARVRHDVEPPRLRVLGGRGCFSAGDDLLEDVSPDGPPVEAGSDASPPEDGVEKRISHVSEPTGLARQNHIRPHHEKKVGIHCG